MKAEVRCGRPVTERYLEHYVIYRDDNTFASWPFNHGLWKTGDSELLVGFTRQECSYADLSEYRHGSVGGPKSELVTCRSLDSGRTWGELSVVAICPLDEIALLYEKGRGDVMDLRTTDTFRTGSAYPAIDLGNPFHIMSIGTIPNTGSPVQEGWARAWLRTSQDGGRTWQRPRLLPLLGWKWMFGRPAYIQRPDGVILLFLTVNRSDGSEGRPVVFASFDGARNWTMVSVVMPERPEMMVICPAPLMLGDGRILVALRCQAHTIAAWTEVYESDDGGLSWRFRSRVNDVGSPADLTLTEDGRVVAVYGYRMPPYGIRAKVSEDDGATWGPETVLRDDGGSWDLGYPRVMALRGNRVFTAYYFHKEEEWVKGPGGVRHIAGTVFELPD